MGVFDLIAAERVALCADLDGLTEDQWATPSLCGSWTVHEVLAHLTVPVTASRAEAATTFVRQRFGINRTIEAMTASRAAKSSKDLLNDLRTNASSQFTPPGAGPGAPLTDVVVHGQDIRRPLGIEHRAPDDALHRILEFLMGNRTTGFMPSGRTRGLRFVASDIDWSKGSGPTVEGPAQSLAMALTGRKVALPELDGDGLADLTSRIG